MNRGGERNLGGGAEPWIRHPAEPTARDRAETAKPAEKSEIEGSWLTQVWPNAVRWFHPRRKGTNRHRSKFDPGGDTRKRRVPSDEALLSFKTVEVELVWIRFASEADSAREKTTRPVDGDDSTLSVCLVVSWPPTSAVDAAADYPEATGTLRAVIDVFEGLKHGAGPTSSRSQIEDGRFVGWMSYPDVLRAEAAFKRFREGISVPGLSIRLRTRQERLPFQWRRDAEHSTAGDEKVGGGS